MSRRRFRKKQLGSLISVDDVQSGRTNIFKHDRENAAARLSDDASDEIRVFWEERYQAASTITMEVREKMANYDKIYKGEWRDGQDDENRIFLPKTREELLVVYSFLLSIVAELNPLVEMEPLGSQTIWGIEEDYKRAKLGEAFVNYYMNEQWRFKDVAMPQFLKHFLKYPLAVFKVSYLERDWKPDLDLNVVDRAFLYLDPNATQFRDQRWTLEEFYVPRSYAYDMIDNGDWYAGKKEMDYIEGYSQNTPSENLDRIFDTSHRRFNTSIDEDDMIKCFECWQYPREGLPDNYTVFFGEIEDGLIVRYGRNPFPYKGIPYVGASYDPGERPDGESFISQQEALQKVINTFLNLRLTDVRKNINQSSIVASVLVDTQTQDDIKGGNRIVRAAPEAQRFLEQSNKRMQDLMAELPSGTSTKELLTMDLPYIQQQFQDSSNVRDVFKGVTPPAGTPLGTFQELLARSQGVFRPVIRSLMHSVEDVARIMMSYARDPYFFDEERLIRIIGKNKYEETLEGWYTVGDNTAYKSVSPDELDVETSFNAVNGADAAINRTMLTNVLAETMQAMGQVPGLVDKIAEEFDFNEIFAHMINISNTDIEALRLSDHQKQQRQVEKQKQQQEAMAQQQQQLQQQMQYQAMLEKSKQSAKAEGEIQVNSQNNSQQGQMALMKEQAQFQHSAQLSVIDTTNKIKEIVTKITTEHLSDVELEKLKFELDKLRMRLEATLESKASVSNVGHDFNITNNNPNQ